MWVRRSSSGGRKTSSGRKKKLQENASKAPSAVRGADPRSVWLTRGGSAGCSAVAPPLINDWTEQRQEEEEEERGSISNNYQCTNAAKAPRLKHPPANQTARGGEEGEQESRCEGREGEKKVRIALTWSRRRSNFFQYWNIDPTSAAILGDIEEIFFQRLQ